MAKLLGRNTLAALLQTFMAKIQQGNNWVNGDRLRGWHQHRPHGLGPFTPKNLCLTAAADHLQHFRIACFPATGMVVKTAALPPLVDTERKMAVIKPQRTLIAIAIQKITVPPHVQ